ncbi:MAG: hypothetical protein IKY66_05240 [Bacteroidales bacterium]|nr:hypothetical protein [Bacteroidales bacterium]
MSTKSRSATGNKEGGHRMKVINYPALAGIMASNGETYQSLADLLGTSTSAISRRMKGEVDWSLHEVKAICEHYEKSYYELFT